MADDSEAPRIGGKVHSATRLLRLAGAGHTVEHAPTDDQPHRVVVTLGDGAARVELDDDVTVVADLLGPVLLDVRKVQMRLQAGL